MKLKNILLKYWWAQVGILVLLEVISTSLLLTSFKILTDLFFVLSIIYILTLPVSWVYLIKDGKWWQCIVSFISTVIVSAASVIVSLFICLYLPASDEFGKRHPIPEGLEYSIPHDMGSQETAGAEILGPEPYLLIQNDFQGGIYLYDFYYGALPAGEIYLKCYEVTENIPLSQDRIREESRVPIGESSSYTKLVNSRRFHIFEGDWGDYYAARIEVWHRDSATLQERKLYKKTYRVEGWMR